MTKNEVFLVYSMIRAKPGLDIDITNAHNTSDPETDFIQKYPGLGVMIFLYISSLLRLGQFSQNV